MKDTNDRKQLGENIKKFREYAGFSQDEVAQFLGIPRTAITNIESGARKIDILELKKIANLFSCSLDDLTSEKTGEKIEESVDMVARTTSGLSPSDREEVLRFAQFLSSKGKEKKSE